MKFSVVIPVYNKEKFLGECFRSLESQTFRDFEVVLVNDGSQDASGGLCDEFAKSADFPVTVVHKENQGLLLARRDGVSRSTGDYILHHDPDDLLRRSCLEAISDALAKTGADVAWFCFSQRADYSDKVGGVDGVDVATTLSLADARMLVCEGGHNSIDTKVMRRELAQKLRVYEEHPRVMIGEDLLQSVALYSLAPTTVFIPEPLEFYNQNDQSSTRNYGRKSIDDIAVVTEFLLRNAKEWGDEFFDAACAGAARQLCGVAAMIMDASMGKECQDEELLYLSRIACKLHLADRTLSNLNWYHSAIMASLVRGYFWCVKSLIRLKKIVTGSNRGE